MISHIARLLQRFYQCSQQMQPDPVQHQPSSEIMTELGDLRKFSLNSLMAFLAILAAPKALQPALLTLLLYTNSLRLSNTRFLCNFLTALSTVLHVIPLLVISCMACVQLVTVVQSPALAVVTLFSGVLPLVTMAIRRGQLVGIGTEASSPALPVRMRDVVVPAAFGSAESGLANGN